MRRSLAARRRREPRTQVVVDAGAAGVTRNGERLSSVTVSLLRELRESRARIVAVADEERRRIERDLHDGPQQRLVALRIRLELAAENLGASNSSAASLFRELGADAEAAIEDLQALARGVYPGLLADLGLAAALRGAALRGPLPVTIVAPFDRRFSRDVEVAAYFCCLEAVQNATKHAQGASGVRITLTEREGALEIEVRDDGAGFDPELITPGAGLTNMGDRITALGGRFEIRSAPGKGTRLLAAIPLDG